MTTRMTKSDARNAVKAKGYTIHHETSSCGDYAHGSREYWAKSGSDVNQFGRPNQMATISKLSTGWVINY